MAKLPNQKRILREDVREAPNWIEKLLYPLNSFMESIYFALNRNLTFQENIRSQIQEIEFQTKTDYGTAIPLIDGFEQQKFASRMGVRPVGVIILQILEKDGNPITYPVSLDWNFINNEIVINYVSGLSASTKYILRVLCV